MKTLIIFFVLFVIILVSKIFAHFLRWWESKQKYYEDDYEKLYNVIQSDIERPELSKAEKEYIRYELRILQKHPYNNCEKTNKLIMDFLKRSYPGLPLEIETTHQQIEVINQTRLS